jgi:hypothetical protein
MDVSSGVPREGNVERVPSWRSLAVRSVVMDPCLRKFVVCVIVVTGALRYILTVL